MVLPLFDMCAVPRRSPGEAHQQETCRFDRDVKGGIIQRHLTRARRGSISCGGPGGRDTGLPGSVGKTGTECWTLGIKSRFSSAPR
jgi:hypothetical protein